jgi:hypothetical protein
MLQFADWAGLPIQPSQTPYEYTTFLQQHFPTRKQELTTITQEYVYKSFAGDDSISTGSAAYVSSYESSLAWSRLRPEMMKAVVRRFLPGRMGEFVAQFLDRIV